MADSTVAVSLTRTDQPDAVVSLVRSTSDTGRREGPGRKTLPAGSGSTEYVAWTSTNDGNGSAFTDLAFDRLLIVIDPDNALAADDAAGDLGVWVLAYYTAIAGGSSTSIGLRFFLRRRTGFMALPSSLAASGTTITRELTKVSFFNANASNDVTVQVEVELPPED